MPISPCAVSSRIARNGGWKRKFSCTISGTPRAAQAATIASQSAMVGPNGFCTIAGRFSPAASSTSGRCERHRGRDVDEVGLLLAQHGGGVGVVPLDPELRAALSALTASRSHTATSSTSLIEPRR